MNVFDGSTAAANTWWQSKPLRSISISIELRMCSLAAFAMFCHFSCNITWNASTMFSRSNWFIYFFIVGNLKLWMLSVKLSSLIWLTKTKWNYWLGVCVFIRKWENILTKSWNHHYVVWVKQIDHNSLCIQNDRVVQLVYIVLVSMTNTIISLAWDAYQNLFPFGFLL